ncbi:MAG: PAS domain-containing protein [Alphaproteobacteria bacterium]|nr:PAS domain-containing protein [Alphaproteobacteria bacterium]
MAGDDIRRGGAGAGELLVRTSAIHDDLLEIPGLRQLWQRWSAARQAADGRLPARADFDVLELKDCLGNLMLLDVETGGRDFRYRVYGTNVALADQADMTGRLVSELAPTSARFLARLYREVCRDKSPLFYRQRLFRNRSAELWDALVVPLASDRTAVDQIMTATFPRPDLGGR